MSCMENILVQWLNPYPQEENWVGESGYFYILNQGLNPQNGRQTTTIEHEKIARNVKRHAMYHS